MFQAFLLFVAADNDLSTFADRDIGELASVPVAQFLQVDQRARWGDRDPNCYRLTRVGGAEHKMLLAQEINTGTSGALRDFLSWSREQHVTLEESLLVLWGHGDGWVGTLQDFLNEDRLDLRELTEAIAGFRFKAVGLDACIMATLEVFHALAPYTDFVVSSQEIEPKTGWSYALVNHEETDLGAYFDRLANTYVSQPFEKPLCLSLVRLHALPEILGELDRLSRDLLRDVPRFQAVAEELPRVANAEYVDLVVLLERLAAAVPDVRRRAQDLQSLIESQLILRRYGRDAGHRGVSIWCPTAVDAFKIERYASLAFAAACPGYAELVHQSVRIKNRSRSAPVG